MIHIATEIITNPKLLEITQKAICNKLTRFAQELADQMSAAKMHVYMVHLSPYGKQHTITVGHGEDVRACFANKYDPFFTMTARSIEENIPINIPGAMPTSEIGHTNRVNITTTEKNNVDSGRRQVAAIMHAALVTGGVINQEDKIPWASLESRLTGLGKVLQGWPGVSRSFTDYSSYNKQDINLILSSRDVIKIVAGGDSNTRSSHRDSTPADLDDILGRLNTDQHADLFEN